jgi:hypothetical protein
MAASGRSVSRGKGKPSPLATADAAVRRTLIDGSDVYFSTEKGTIARVAKSGGTVVPIVTAAASKVMFDLPIVVDAAYVYYMSGDDAMRVPKSGGAPTKIWGVNPGGLGIRGLTDDGTTAYVADGDQIVRIPGGDPLPRRVARGRSKPSSSMAAASTGPMASSRRRSCALRRPLRRRGEQRKKVVVRCLEDRVSTK